MNPQTGGQRADRLRIGVIGAGRVGPVLARALAGAGHEIVAFNAASDDARERVEAMLPGVLFESVENVVRASELVIFAIPKTELSGIINGLTETDAWQPGQIVLHTAAEPGFQVFASAMSKGVIPVAFHPAMVFTGTSLDLARLHEATVAVSAPTPVLPIAQALAVEVGAEPVVVAEANRAAYADAVEALNELTGALVRQASESLTGLGLEHVRRTVAGVARAAVDEALGPE